jgi:RNA polymerase sigma factor (sigma-70 family)
MDDCVLDEWFCQEVLPLEAALLRYIRRNWRVANDVFDLMHDVYTLALEGAARGLPDNTQAYLFAITKHHLMRQARRARIVAFDLVADMERVEPDQDFRAVERHMMARDELRRAQRAMDALPPRRREAVYLRKVEGLTTREAAERMGVGIDAIEQHLTKGMRALADFMGGGEVAATGEQRPRPGKASKSR